MSSRNNETDGAIFTISIALTVAFIMFALIYALLLFGALLLTIWAVCAWNDPVTVFGQTMEPHEARAFIGRGILGAVALPVFVAFCAVLFKLDVKDAYWVHFMLGGYAVGSLGIEILIAQEKEKRAAQVEFLPPPINVTPPTPTVVRQQPAQPFTFATWDDEAEEG